MLWDTLSLLYAFFNPSMVDYYCIELLSKLVLFSFKFPTHLSKKYVLNQTNDNTALDSGFAI